MKKLIVGLMGLMLIGAMALPAAAQGRNWNRDNQTNSRRDNNQRDNSGFSRRGYDQRDNRYNGGRTTWDQSDSYDRDGRWQQRHREGSRFIDRSFGNRRHQH
jgi:hypothetical protein